MRREPCRQERCPNLAKRPANLRNGSEKPAENLQETCDTAALLEIRAALAADILRLAKGSPVKGALPFGAFRRAPSWAEPRRPCQSDPGCGPATSRPPEVRSAMVPETDGRGRRGNGRIRAP